MPTCQVIWCMELQTLNMNLELSVLQVYCASSLCVGSLGNWLQSTNHAEDSLMILMATLVLRLQCGILLITQECVNKLCSIRIAWVE